MIFHAKAIRVLFVLVKAVTVPFPSKNSFISEIFLVFTPVLVIISWLLSFELNCCCCSVLVITVLLNCVFAASEILLFWN